jgi:hypothetical protein
MTPKNEELLSMFKKIVISTFVFSSCVLLQAGVITAQDISSAQKKWGECIVEIGKESTPESAKQKAKICIDTLYAYDNGGVLFKPTKAHEQEFRLSKEDALSYFVTGKISEDHGFALQPWSNVRFENAGNLIDSDSAVSMGNYYFTDSKTNKEVKVDYTFGYLKDGQENLRITVHHSSLPYEPKH